MKLSLFYMTFPSAASANKFSKLLITKKLAACTNLLPAMKSTYRWKGKTVSAKECVLIIKAQSKNFAAIEKLMTAEHPYDCPCLIEIPVGRVSALYKQWLLS